MAERPAGQVTARVCICEGKIRICVGFSSVFSLQESINQIKATIAELETVGEDHRDDIISSVFFTDANPSYYVVFKYILQQEETFQKIEDSEKQIVQEAKMKPDKHQRTAV